LTSNYRLAPRYEQRSPDERDSSSLRIALEEREEFKK